MNSNDDKPTEVLDELEGVLEGVKELLDDEGQPSENDLSDYEKMIPVLDEAIPELSKPDLSIPELNERIDINKNFTISLDAEHSTETVEQQLIRTRYEEQPAAPELIPDLVSDATNEVTEASIENEDESTFSLSLVDKEYDADNIVELNLQQQDLEQLAQQYNEDTNNRQDEMDDHKSEDIPEYMQVNTLTSDQQHTKELILQNAWQKVERLLMDNLPPQLSGAFLHLLNSRIDENRQQLIDELSLLDEDVFHELLEALEIDQDF